MVLYLGICFTVVTVLYIVVEGIRFRVNKELTTIKFNKIIEKENLPIITLTNGETSFNFLVDSGSNASHFDINAMPLLKEYSKTNITSVGFVGAQSKDENTYEWINIPVYSNKQRYSDDFCLLDLKIPFKTIKEESGIVLHGILGVSFLKKYRFALDFEELKMYMKWYTLLVDSLDYLQIVLKL